MTCFAHLDLCIRVAFYLSPTEVLQFRLINTTTLKASLLYYKLLLESDGIEFLVFKPRRDLFSSTHACCRLSRPTRHSGWLVVGGSFSSMNTECLWLQGAANSLQYNTIEEAVVPVQIGSCAATIDAFGSVAMFGGWDDEEWVAVDTTCIYGSETSQQDRSWRMSAPLHRPACFSSVGSLPSGHLVVTGGGSSPYRGADVYADCILQMGATSAISDPVRRYDVVPPMPQPRCGHSTVTLLNGSMAVLGGFGGDMIYHTSVDVLSDTMDRWTSTSLPPMQQPRSGFAAVLGPGGCIFVAGGSPDGAIGLRGTERCDPREGLRRWEVVAEMQEGRGYAAGGVGPSGYDFIVSGGMDDFRMQGGMEQFEFRMNRWISLYPQLRETATPDEEDGEDDPRLHKLHRACHQMFYLW